MKNTNGTITRYLTDDNSLTGYSQVLEELNGGYGVQKRYVYGLNLISQTDTIGTAGTQYYGYDGIGSIRLLTDMNGNVTDTYDYDAFGTIVYSSHVAPGTNIYLFQGEQYDSDLGQYYLRSRYMNADIGRFWSMDSYEGEIEQPLTLQKYIFVSNNPINMIDPLGMQLEDESFPNWIGIFQKTDMYFQAHRIPFSGYAHSYIRVIPVNTKKWQKYLINGCFTIGAGPSSFFNPKLLSGINRPTDISDPTVLSIELSGNGFKNQDDMVGALINAFNGYNNSLEYSTSSKSNEEKYDSNSYTMGLILAAGITPPQINSFWTQQLLGITKPVPKYYFVNNQKGE